MPTSRSLLVAALTLATLVGCAGAEKSQACPLVGIRTGISIGIAAAIAEQVEAAEMTVCWDGSCRTRAVTLQPSSRTVDDGCTGSGSDAVCSAHAEATGERVGFADIADLPASPVEVTVVLTDPAGARILDQMLMLTPKMAHPNGAHCGGRPQGRITVDADAKAHAAG
ncbi:MAG TPA: hypothetical protein VFX61_18325 [Micromonosporaceae bacterium]|nr:hypothetical protein [Micromonosporaceae bacterium]